MRGASKEVTRRAHHSAIASVDSWSYGITVEVMRGKDNEDDEWYIYITSGSSCTRDKELLCKLSGQEIYDLLHPKGDGTIARPDSSALLKLYLSKSVRKKNDD